MHYQSSEQVSLKNPQGESQFFVSNENSFITLPKDIVGLIRIPAATHTGCYIQHSSSGAVCGYNLHYTGSDARWRDFSDPFGFL